MTVLNDNSCGWLQNLPPRKNFKALTALVWYPTPTLDPYNPLVMKIVQSPKGGFIKVRRWIELSTEDIFMMRMDRILTMSECTDDKLIQIYNNYVETEDDDPEIGIFKPTGKVRPYSKMGYIASVEDARKKFEVLFKINQEPKES